MALVRKILEATIPSGGSSATFTDSDIPNSLIRVYSTNSNIYPQNISLSGNTLTVTYEVVSSDLGVAVELVKQGLEIDDNLTSDNTDHALSSKQGKVLKGLIDGLDIPDNISDLQDVDITDIEDEQVLAWNETAQKFVNVDQSGGSDIQIINTEWIASTSSSEKTKLCQDVALSPGTYMLVIHTPYGATNVSNYIFSVVANDNYLSNCSIIGDTSYRTYTLMFTLNENSDVYFSSGTGTNASWDSRYLDEAYANYIKIG